MAGPNYPSNVRVPRSVTQAAPITRPDPWMGGILKSPHTPSAGSLSDLADILKQPHDPGGRVHSASRGRLARGVSLPGLLTSPGGRALAKQALRRGLPRVMGPAGLVIDLIDLIDWLSDQGTVTMIQPEIVGVAAHWAHPGYSACPQECGVPSMPPFTGPYFKDYPTTSAVCPTITCTAVRSFTNPNTEPAPVTGQTYRERYWYQIVGGPFNGAWWSWTHRLWKPDSSSSVPDPTLVPEVLAQAPRYSLETAEQLEQRAAIRLLDRTEKAEPGRDPDYIRERLPYRLPSVDFDYGFPGGGGKPPTVGHHVRKPPPKGETERKTKLLPKEMGIAIAALGKVTEPCEMIEAVYDTLPASVRRWRGRDGRWRDREITCLGMAGALARHADKIDAKAAIAALIENELEDRVLGAAGQAAQAAAKKARVRSVLPSRISPALRARPEGPGVYDQSFPGGGRSGSTW